MASADGGFYAGARTFSWLAELVQLPLDQVNFLICQVAALLFAIFYRKVLNPNYVSAEVRHVVALVAGISLGYFSFGYQISHICVQATLSYIITTSANPHIMQRMVLFVSMLYLCSMHILRLKYDYGGWTVDITGPLMITTQKVSSMAFFLHDGLTRDEEKLTPEERRLAIKRKPTMLEFFSYIFHFQAIMCGPLVFYNDYMDFIEGRNYAKGCKKLSDEEPSSPQPSPTTEVVKKLGWSIFWALFLVVVVPYFPISWILDEKYLYHTPWFSKLLYLYVATSVVRSKYYHAWLLGESICNASGLGFNGYSSDGQSKWDLMANVDILGFELPPNFRGLLEAWNKSTQTWLRVVCYNRAPSYKTLCTYLLSAIWHGFYPGYYLTFFQGALLTLAARNVRRIVRPFFQANQLLARLYDTLTCLATVVALAYIIFPFILLELTASLKVYRSFYFIGHFIILFGIVGLSPLAKMLGLQQRAKVL